MFNFDARTVAPWVGFEIVPAGWAKVAIRKSNLKPNSAQNGDFLELQIEILEGPAKGKIVFERLNIRNPSVEAVEIAYRKLSSICYCVGVLTITAQQQQDFVAGPLHGIPFFAEIGVQKSQRGNDMNIILSYKDINGVDPGKQGQMQGGVMPPAPPAPSMPTQQVAPPVASAPAGMAQQPGQWSPSPQVAAAPAPATPAPPAPAPAPQQWQPPAGAQQPGQWQQPETQPAQPASAPGVPGMPAWAQPPQR